MGWPFSFFTGFRDNGKARDREVRADCVSGLVILQLKTAY
jgi:hypothetical protein